MLPKPALRIATGKLSGLAILLVMWLLSAAAPPAAPTATPTASETAGEIPAASAPVPPALTPAPTPPAAADQLPDDRPEGAEGAPPAEAGGRGQEAVDLTPDQAAPEAPDLAKPQAPEPHADPAGDPAEAPAPPPPLTVPVLLYHHLEPGADGANGAILSIEEFAAQMAWLAANGYRTITTAELLDWLEGRQSLPERPVMITFDDGYRSNYTDAFPVLQQHGFTGVIFMVTGFAGQTIGRFEYLGWDEMRAMAESGVIEIQAHSHDGHRQIGGEAALVAWSPDEILADWFTLTEAADGAGLPPVTAYAYPFGAHDEEAVETLRAAGVRLGFTVAPGRVARGDDPMRLSRLVVYPAMGECGFARLVTGRTVCD